MWPYVVTYLDWTCTNEWHMVWYGMVCKVVKIGFQKDSCNDKISLCAQNVFTV